MNNIEKLVKPRQLNSNAWYIKLHRYIGWNYDSVQFCPFFWKTVLGIILLPFLTTFWISLWCFSIVLFAIAYIANAVWIAICWLAPGKLIYYVEELYKIEVQEKKRIAYIGLSIILIFISIITIGVNLIHGSTLLMGFISGAAVIAGAILIIAIAFATIVAFSLIYGYWHNAILMKYCPTIEWEE